MANGAVLLQKGPGEEDVPMVTIDLEEEVLPAPSQGENISIAQRRATTAADRYLHDNLAEGCHADTTEGGAGGNDSSAMWIAAAVEDADSVNLTDGSRRSTTSLSGRDPRSSPSPEQVERLIPIVRTVLRAEGVKTVSALHPQNIRDIL
jgi:hypothetical protein